MKNTVIFKGCFTAEVDFENNQINFSQYGENLLSISIEELKEVNKILLAATS